MVLGPFALALLISSSGFADRLYESGEYAAAAVEYERALWDAGDTLSLPLEALRLARCWQECADPGRALAMYDFLSSRLPPGYWRGCALMGAGSVCEQVGNLGRARQDYLAASGEFADSCMRERCEVLAALCTGRSGDWQGAAEDLEEVPCASLEGARPRLASIARSAARPPRRSAFLCAAASAVLPGAGQAACGHWMDGASSLLMTAGTGALFAMSLHDGDRAEQFLFGWLALSFYGGGILGGARAADRWNEARMQAILSEVPEVLARYACEPPAAAPLPTD